MLFFTKYFYGGYGDKEQTANAGDNPKNEVSATIASILVPGKLHSDWPLWEIFIRSKQGLDHKHVGSLHAADAQMAIENARDVYTRRQEGVSIWAVESKYIHASNPDEAESFYEPANDKVYRHPTFYDLPDEVKHM